MLADSTPCRGREAALVAAESQAAAYRSAEVEDESDGPSARRR